ncbi:hypothetical protein HPP92_007617 [Vanilla planifolia]|uniref:Poly [ADP-ribose] polymerase n=1 Tax=Vanilla planifolia TaxID=51239 RepID=A0A835RKK9_VANPL|nr:hypothetical protein HPP92_007617 [Vanilla planifolia]
MEESIRVLRQSGQASASVAALEPLSLGITASSGITGLVGNSKMEVLLIPCSDFSSGFLSPDQLLLAFKNFQKSRTPSRFFLFSEDTWVGLEHQVADELKEGFSAGKTTLEISINGKHYLFDFLRMCRIDPATGRLNSIAWVDVEGQCFFPRNAVDERVNPSDRKIELGLRIDESLLMPSRCPPCFLKKNDHVHCDKEEISDENTEISSVGFDNSRWPCAKLLRDDDRFYKAVEQLFHSGMKAFTPSTVITSIHKCRHCKPPGKLASFQMQMRATTHVRGIANVKFGWYGTSARNIATILSYGFRQHNRGLNGLASYGNGIHLSLAHAAYASAIFSETDENGGRHMLLCRIILGNSEKVEACSLQDRPSCEGFDSGVDDLVNPKWYVVWSSHMNTNILPEYIRASRM